MQRQGRKLPLLYYAINYSVFVLTNRRRRISALSGELAVLAELCGNKRTSRLFRSPIAETPMLIGLFRPAIILPERDYTDAQLYAVLQHELTHLRRKDVLVKWLSIFACAVHWFNPLVWLVRREIDRACELSCDEAVIRNLDKDGNCNTSFEIISHGGYSADAVANLKALIQNDERLSLEILKDEIAYFKSIFQTITAVLYAFVAFISIFALVNLINTVITNVLSRKKEIGIMQAIGLDNKQLRVMLYVEHSMVLLGSFFLSLLLGGFGGYVLCNAISNVGGLSFVQYQFPIWQITVYFAVIIIVQLMLTTFLNRSVNKQSAIERIYQH